MSDQVTTYEVIKPVSLKHALMELQRFVQDPRLLRRGLRLENFGGMLVREFLGNWLVCAAVNIGQPDRLIFTSDPTDGDGVFLDTLTGITQRSEHVAVLLRPGTPNLTGQAEALILQRIKEKNDRGASYGAGRCLVVLMEEAAGQYWPNRLGPALPTPLHFAAVWVVGLQSVDGEGYYYYSAALLDPAGGDAPIIDIRIAPDFQSWEVERRQ